MKRLYTVTDLGPGDGGKGGVVHKLCTHANPHHVVKVGGAQGSHGVCTSRGEAFAFSQFGCGTFENVRTHISGKFIVDPHGLLNEAQELRYQHGVQDPFMLLTVDERALCTTVWHQITSRLEELARKDAPRGTIGVGVGVAHRSALRYPDAAVYAGDVRDMAVLERKLLSAARHAEEELTPLLRSDDFLPSDRAAVEDLARMLRDRDLMMDFMLARYAEFASLVDVVDVGYLRSNVLGAPGAVVVESSHGVLTDSRYGFAPHTSKLRTVPEESTWRMLREEGYDGRVYKLGVTRAYQIRHGAGPMPTDDPGMYETLLPGSNKEENRYQGRVRVGPLDFVALRYALRVCGGPRVFDGIAVTWFDQIRTNGVWHVCTSYGNTAPDVFASPFSLRVKDEGETAQRAWQEKMTHALGEVTPYVRTYDIPASLSREECQALCQRVMQENVGVPVRMMSFGPTEKDKVLL